MLPQVFVLLLHRTLPLSHPAMSLVSHLTVGDLLNGTSSALDAHAVVLTALDLCFSLVCDHVVGL
jgi:hypothetical protein